MYTFVYIYFNKAQCLVINPYAFYIFPCLFLLLVLLYIVIINENLYKILQIKKTIYG